MSEIESSLQTVAVIPARGGSKGIVGKNVRLLAGKPLVAHSIEQARQVALIDRVLVSTDDAEIESVALAYGAEVIKRPAEISGDTASSESALLHALEHLEIEHSYVPDILVFLQCTSPLTSARDIVGTVQLLLSENADSALSVTPFHHFLWRQDSPAGAAGVNHDKRYRQLRQDREPEFLENGAVYVMRTAEFKQLKHRFFGKTVMYVMPPERSIEIDDPLDLFVVEALLRRHQQLENETQSSYGEGDHGRHDKHRP